MDFLESERYTQPVHLSYGGLQVQQRHAHKHHSYQIGNQEYSSTVPEDQRWEPPEGAEADTDSNSTHDVFPHIVIDVRIVCVVCLH